jgi:hypothetical protein
MSCAERACHILNVFVLGQIELPEYSTEDIMRKRIIAACTYGIGGFLIA